MIKNMKYYVNVKAAKGGDGSEKKPFNTIQKAADLAVAGDEVIVAPGIYREAVNPKNAGMPGKPVIYRSEKPLGAHITGAEVLSGWTKVDGADGTIGTVWTARVSNKIFGDFNPYTTLVSGDWFIAYMTAHLGDVFLNEKSMYEVQSLEEVKKAEPSESAWDTEFSTYKWYAKQDDDTDETIFFANFHDKVPNK